MEAASPEPAAAPADDFQSLSELKRRALAKAWAAADAVPLKVRRPVTHAVPLPLQSRVVAVGVAPGSWW